MTGPQKRVSIGLPVYNGERFIATALESLLGQTYADFELIVSDNASTDRTEEICRAFAERDARIRYIRQPENQGAVPNFNHVFEVSDSAYFKWAAVDDECHPNFLEKAVEVLDSHPDVIWCHSRSSHIDAYGELLEDADSLNVSYADRQAHTPDERFGAVLMGKGGCLDSYGLIRSDAIRKTPLYLPYYGPEKVFIAELALLGRYQEIPETLFYPRVLTEGSGNIKTAAEQQAFIDTRRIHRFPLTRVRFLLGYLSAIHRSRLTISETLKCWGHVLRWLFQVSKWHSVVRRAFRGQGVGGRNIGRLKRIDRRNA